jgi:CheY-like chemotaxis protein
MADERVAVFSSENQVNIPVYPLDVFVTTASGIAQLHGATSLPPEALALLVLLDGKATVGDLEAALPQMPAEKVRALIRSLLGVGFIRAPTIAETDGLLDIDAFLKAGPAGEEPSNGAQQSADREAEKSVPHLERAGYYVSIARQAVKPAAGSGGKPSVFAVDDDPDVAALVRRLLEGAGFAVTTAATRNEVLARLNAKPPPDLVILDVALPDLDGFDVLQKLKTHPVLKAVPVIMLTADTKRESVARGLFAGADGYLTKPFDGAALVAGVRAVLGITAPS